MFSFVFLLFVVGVGADGLFGLFSSKKKKRAQITLIEFIVIYSYTGRREVEGKKTSIPFYFNSYYLFLFSFFFHCFCVKKQLILFLVCHFGYHSI